MYQNWHLLRWETKMKTHRVLIIINWQNVYWVRLAKEGLTWYKGIFTDDKSRKGPQQIGCLHLVYPSGEVSHFHSVRSRAITLWEMEPHSIQTRTLLGSWAWAHMGLPQHRDDTVPQLVFLCPSTLWAFIINTGTLLGSNLYPHGALFWIAQCWEVGWWLCTGIHLPLETGTWSLVVCPAG